MKVDYSKGKIYKITNDYNDDVYINYTCDTLVKRFSCHKKNSQYELFKNGGLYKLMNEIGFDRFRIQLVENCPCEDKYQLCQKTREYIRNYGTIINKQIPGRTRQQYYKEYKEINKEQLKQKNVEYKELNKDKIKEKKNAPFTCVCGCVIKYSHKSQHEKTKKHADLMDLKSPKNEIVE
jgi:hypothetical protein